MATSATNVLKQFVKTLEVLPKVIVLDIGEGRTYSLRALCSISRHRLYSVALPRGLHGERSLQV